MGRVPGEGAGARGRGRRPGEAREASDQGPTPLEVVPGEPAAAYGTEDYGELRSAVTDEGAPAQGSAEPGREGPEGPGTGYAHGDFDNGGEAYPGEAYPGEVHPEDRYPEDRYGDDAYEGDVYDAYDGDVYDGYGDDLDGEDGYGPLPPGPGQDDPEDASPGDEGQAPAEDDGPGGRSVPYPGLYARTAPRAARRPRHWLRALVGALVVVVVLGVVGFFHVNGEINPSGPLGRYVTVSIPSGASTYRIGQILAERDVIHGPTVWEVYLKLEGAGALQAGSYRMRTNEPYAKAIATLQAGPYAASYKLVVPEGFTAREIGQALARLHVGISAAQFDAAALGGQVRSPYQPAGTSSLEGLLFPATYPVTAGETADQLVQYMVSTFDQHAAALGLSAAAARLHVTPYEVVEVASIVEREAKLAVDRGPIASAIYNRLRLGMPIGAESTLLYGLGDPRGPVDVTTPNPYNSLLNKGLPPTPISNPGVPSLEAAMNPPKTDLLYWVEVNPDGKMGFGADQAQFAQLQAECRAAKLC